MRVTVRKRKTSVLFFRKSGRSRVRMYWNKPPINMFGTKISRRMPKLKQVVANCSEKERRKFSSIFFVTIVNPERLELVSLFINYQPLLISDWHEIASRQHVTRAGPYKGGSCDSWGPP